MGIMELTYDARYRKSRGIGRGIIDGDVSKRVRNNIPKIKDQD